MKRLTGLTTLLVLLLLNLCVGEDASFSVGDLKLSTPKGWYSVPVPEGQPNTRAVIASNQPADKQAVMMFSIVPKKGRSLEAFSSATRRFVIKEMDGVLEFERKVKLDGAPAHSFVYEGRSRNSAQGRRKFMRTVVERGDSFYIIHGVADHIPFAKYAGTMENVVNSAKWK